MSIHVHNNDERPQRPHRTCPEIIEAGRRKGQICGLTLYTDRCPRHPRVSNLDRPNDNSVCHFVFKTGARKGLKNCTL
jgi:hypothetical protein